ncbi:MAG: Dna2/Cas4 domain-containing protein, partial [Phycisphaeraceae bacterium]
MPANVSPLADEQHLTLDMVRQFAYCPRRYHLMYIEGRWEDNAYTIDGRHIHRRVAKLDHVLPDAQNGSTETTDAEASPPANSKADEGDEPPIISRSVPLSSDTLGLTAKLDLVSSDGEEAVPVDPKRGRVPNNPERSWKPERVQLMAQGLLLREH